MKQIVHLNGKFIPFEEATISPVDRGFNFADGVYEVIRVYEGNLFQADGHLQRLQYGLNEMKMKQVDIGELKAIASRLIEDNNLTQGEAVIYIQVTRGAAPRTHKFPPENTALTIFMSANPFHHPPNEREYGTKVILVPDTRWARCDIKTINLISNILARQCATEHGASEALFVRDGVVLEGTHCNFCAVFKGRFVTAPSSNYILSGITRKLVLELCGELKIPLQLSPIFGHQLKNADELMIVGTTVEITPVVKVDDWVVGNGKPGSITQMIQKAFREKISNAIKLQPK